MDMTSKYWTVLALALAAALVVGASGAVAQTADWSGFYVGVQAGSSWGNDNNTLSQLVVPTELSADFKGFVGRAHLGWNTQMDSIVLGLETDVEASFMDADFGFTDDTFELDVDVMGSFRAKAGYAVENVHIYATGGLAVQAVHMKTQTAGLPRVSTQLHSDLPLVQVQKSRSAKHSRVDWSIATLILARRRLTQQSLIHPSS